MMLFCKIKNVKLYIVDQKADFYWFLNKSY